MKHVLVVCAIAFALETSAATPALGQSRPDVPMRRGISVELPVAPHAVQDPQADQEDAFVITVTESGIIYRGTEPTTPAAAANAARSESVVYLKADGRTSYANVAKVLDALRAAGVRTLTVLAISQHDDRSGPIRQPEGVEISLTAPSASAVSVSVGSASVQMNHEQVPWTTLESKLEQALRAGAQKDVSEEAAPSAPFADVVRAVDSAVAAGAKIHLQQGMI